MGRNLLVHGYALCTGFIGYTQYTGKGAGDAGCSGLQTSPKLVHTLDWPISMNQRHTVMITRVRIPVTRIVHYCSTGVALHTEQSTYLVVYGDERRRLPGTVPGTIWHLSIEIMSVCIRGVVQQFNQCWSRICTLYSTRNCSTGTCTANHPHVESNVRNVL